MEGSHLIIISASAVYRFLQYCKRWLECLSVQGSWLRVSDSGLRAQTDYDEGLKAQCFLGVWLRFLELEALRLGLLIGQQLSVGFTVSLAQAWVQQDYHEWSTSMLFV